MPLIIVLLGLFVPRVVIAILWLLTTWFQGMFATLLWPILGFIFLPTTLLWYSIVQNWLGGQLTIASLLGFAIAFLLDVTPLARRHQTVAA